MALHTGIAMTVNAIQAAAKSPLKKLFSIDIAKAHLPLNNSLKSSVCRLPPLSVNSKITPRTRWNIHSEKWWYKWIPPIGAGTLVSSFLWMLKVISSSIISSFMGKREIKILAAQELQQIVAQLTESNRVDFSRLLEDWETRWDYFLSEKTYDENGVNFCYTHRKLRGAYRSLKEHLDVLFAFQDFPIGTMPNTNNALESFNSWLKKKLQLHSGISRNRREKPISNLIMAYKPRSRKGS